MGQGVVGPYLGITHLLFRETIRLRSKNNPVPVRREPFFKMLAKESTSIREIALVSFRT